MYFFFMLGMLGVCIATASLWLLIVMVPFAVFTHGIILGEERYCEATYDEGYERIDPGKRQVPFRWRGCI